MFRLTDQLFHKILKISTVKSYSQNIYQKCSYLKEKSIILLALFENMPLLKLLLNMIVTVPYQRIFDWRGGGLGCNIILRI